MRFNRYAYPSPRNIDSNLRLQFKSKEELLAALEARRAWATKLDARNAKEHKRAEAKALSTFRKQLRRALKWNYKRLKDEGFDVTLDWKLKPDCPFSHVSELDRVIAALRNDGRKRYVLTVNNFPMALYLLTHDENAKKDVCET